MEYPLVSIAIASYNAQKYICDLMNSILAQKYPNIEVVLMDDCSSDDTLAEVEKYRDRLNEKCSRVIVEKNDANLGITRNFNKALKRCTGDYVFILAGDDFLFGDYIEKSYECSVKNPGTDIIVSNVALVPDETSFSENLDSSVFQIYRSIPEGFFEGDCLKKLYEGNVIALHSFFYKRSVLDVLGLLDEELYIEDWDWNIRIVKAGIKMAQTGEVLIAHRQSPTSISQSVSEDFKIKMLLGQVETLKKHAGLFDKSYTQKRIISEAWPFYRYGKSNGMEKLKKTAHEKMLEQGRMTVFRWHLNRYLSRWKKQLLGKR